MGDADAETAVLLYWLPLGAGGRSVRWNGRMYERVVAARERRRPCDLYHSALVVTSDGVPFVIEMAPVWRDSDPCRVVVCEGPVGTRYLGRLRAFRYEVRCWPHGGIPDVDEAVDSPVVLTRDAKVAKGVLSHVPLVPPLTWGRDEIGAGEMWNSNSLIAWLLAGAGLDTATVTPPMGGRAPGWSAGRHLAITNGTGADAPTAPPGLARCITPALTTTGRCPCRPG
ncbi:MAG TPA: hypothetical protein VHE83_07090 [Mycobacteriales bacterium]|nr:hypothetical protein [Mycobacteriales bacterium]